MLWLWCRLAAAAPIRPLSWGRPCATGAALTRKEKAHRDARAALPPGPALSAHAPEPKTEWRLASEERPVCELSPHTSGCKEQASLILVKFSCVKQSACNSSSSWGISGLHVGLAAEEETKDRGQIRVQTTPQRARIWRTVTRAAEGGLRPRRTQVRGRMSPQPGSLPGEGAGPEAEGELTCSWAAALMLLTLPSRCWGSKDPAPWATPTPDPPCSPTGDSSRDREPEHTPRTEAEPLLRAMS